MNIPVAIQLLVSLFPVSDAPVQSGSEFDACALYTLEEFAAFAKDEGRRHRPTARSFNGVSTTTCWHGTQYDSWSMKIIVQRGNNKADMKMMLDALKKVAAGTTGKAPEMVSGLGDEAFWGQIGPSNGQLHVVLGTDFLTIQTWGKAPGAGTLPETKKLATIIMERFKKLR